MNVGVIIGRFQPLHKGHQAMIRQALDLRDKVLILIGCTGGPPTIKDPWNFFFRSQMIRAAFPAEVEREQIIMAPINDVPYDDGEWIANVRKAVSYHLAPSDYVTLFGHEKDHTSYYLNLFPEWRVLKLGIAAGISATQVRRAYFSKDSADKTDDDLKVPHGVRAIMDRAFTLSQFRSLCDDQANAMTMRERWECVATKMYGGPVLSAVDLLVETPTSILVTERGQYGQGQLALPGGFLNPNETLKAGALREGKEETSFDLGLYAPGEVQYPYPWTIPFDALSRSQRARIITHVLHVRVPREQEVTAADDAQKAFWMPKTALALAGASESSSPTTFTSSTFS